MALLQNFVTKFTKTYKHEKLANFVLKFWFIPLSSNEINPVRTEHQENYTNQTRHQCATTILENQYIGTSIQYINNFVHI